ncbi:unnamed protein product, partial [Musa hybrid cultivar]
MFSICCWNMWLTLISNLKPPKAGEEAWRRRERRRNRSCRSQVSDL